MKTYSKGEMVRWLGRITELGPDLYTDMDRDELVRELVSELLDLGNVHTALHVTTGLDWSNDRRVLEECLVRLPKKPTVDDVLNIVIPTPA